MRRFFPLSQMEPAARSVTLLLWLVGILQGFAQAQASATVPFTREALSLSEGDMSLVLAIARFAGIGALVFSRWGDHSGRRPPFITAFIILVVASGGTALIGTAWQFAALQGAVRLTGAAVGSLGVVLLAESVGGKHRAFAIGIYGAGASFGAGLALAALPLADLGDEAWRLSFALSTIGLAFVPFIARRITESSVFEGSGDTATSIRVLLAPGYAARFWVSSAVALLAASFTSVGLAFSTERLVDDLGLSTTTAVLVSLAGGTIGGAGFFVGGRLADVLGRKPTTIGALFATLAGGIGLYWFESVPLLVASIVVSSFGSFAFVPAAAAHRTELFPTRVRATAGTAGTYLGMIGSALGLLVGRATIDVIGLSETVTLLGGAVIFAIGLTFFLPETRGQSLERRTLT